METLKKSFLKYPIAPAIILSGLFSLTYILFSIHVYDDQAAYYAPMARAFGRGQWDKAFLDFIPPLQPVLAGLLCKIGLHPVTSLQIISCVFFVGSVFPAYFLLKQMLKRSDWAGLATLMYVLAPNIIELSCSGLLNAGRNFFLLFSLWMVISFVKIPRWHKMALLGASLGGLSLIRGEGIAYVPFALLWLWGGLWSRDKKLSAKLAAGCLKSSAIALAVMLAVLTPRIIQVYRSTGIAVLDYRQVKLAARIFNFELKNEIKTQPSAKPTEKRPPMLSGEKAAKVTSRFFDGSYPPYLILAIGGIIIAWKRKEFQITHWIIITTVIFTFIVFYPVPISTRYYSINIPLLCGFGLLTINFAYVFLAKTSVHLKRIGVGVLILAACVQAFEGVKNIRGGTSVYEKRVGEMLAARYTDKGKNLIIASDHPQYPLWADCEWLSITADAHGKLYPNADEIKKADVIIVLREDEYILGPLEKLAFLKPIEHQDNRHVAVFENTGK